MNMVRMIACQLALSGCVAGCVPGDTQPPYSSKGYCYVQSGWQDSMSVCSPLDGYAACYLQCPKAGSDDAKPQAPSH